MTPAEFGQDLRRERKKKWIFFYSKSSVLMRPNAYVDRRDEDSRARCFLIGRATKWRSSTTPKLRCRQRHRRCRHRQLAVVGVKNDGGAPAGHSVPLRSSTSNVVGSRAHFRTSLRADSALSDVAVMERDKNRLSATHWWQKEVPFWLISFDTSITNLSCS